MDEVGFVPAAADRGRAQARPVIWNSDQGSHFISPRYLDRVLGRDIQISIVLTEGSR
ncbi:MAG TPA: hypothetical protein VFZ25_10695 [Chloroflexota bacterium]|nr:hypothetical protein [Chloroflexota bacterium]